MHALNPRIGKAGLQRCPQKLEMRNILFNNPQALLPRRISPSFVRHFFAIFGQRQDLLDVCLPSLSKPISLAILATTRTSARSTDFGC